MFFYYPLHLFPIIVHTIFLFALFMVFSSFSLMRTLLLDQIVHFDLGVPRKYFALQYILFVYNSHFVIVIIILRDLLANLLALVLLVQKAGKNRAVGGRLNNSEVFDACSASTVSGILFLSSYDYFD